MRRKHHRSPRLHLVGSLSSSKTHLMWNSVICVWMWDPGSIFHWLMYYTKSFNITLGWNVLSLQSSEHFICVFYRNKTQMKHWWNEQRLQCTLCRAKTKMQTGKLSHPLAHVAHFSFHRQDWTWGIKKRNRTENNKWLSRLLVQLRGKGKNSSLLH